MKSNRNYLLSSCPPISLNSRKENFSEDFETVKVFETLKIEVSNLLEDRKKDLEQIEVSTEPIFYINIGTFKGREKFRDPNSYYIKIPRNNGKMFFTIRVSEHYNRKNKAKIEATFFDIDGESETEVVNSMKLCLEMLNKRIDDELDSMMLEIERLAIPKR